MPKAQLYRGTLAAKAYSVTAISDSCLLGFTPNLMVKVKNKAVALALFAHVGIRGAAKGGSKYTGQNTHS